MRHNISLHPHPEVRQFNFEEVVNLMTMMSDFNRSRWRNILLALTVVAATAGPALPQRAATNAAKPIAEGEYSTWDIGGFFGTQWFQMYQGTLLEDHMLSPKPIIGVRATQDFGRYFGVEEAFGVGIQPFGSAALRRHGVFATVNEYNYQFAILAWSI